jgi:hypothetical protein
MEKIVPQTAKAAKRLQVRSCDLEPILQPLNLRKPRGDPSTGLTLDHNNAGHQSDVHRCPFMSLTCPVSPSDCGTMPCLRLSWYPLFRGKITTHAMRRIPATYFQSEWSVEVIHRRPGIKLSACQLPNLLWTPAPDTALGRMEVFGQHTPETRLAAGGRQPRDPAPCQSVTGCQGVWDGRQPLSPALCAAPRQSHKNRSGRCIPGESVVK